MKLINKAMLAGVLGMGMMGAGVGLSTAATTGGSTTPPTTRPHEERHPEIRRALMGLRNAKTALEKADHDYDGHRKEALEATDKAIKECEDCLKVKDKK